MDEFGPKMAVSAAPAATVPASSHARLQAHLGVNGAASSDTSQEKDDVEMMVTRLRTRLRQAVATVSAGRPSGADVNAAAAYHHVQRSPPSLAELLANPMALAVTASNAHNGDILASLSAASRLSSQLAQSAANSSRSRGPDLARSTKPVLSTAHLATARNGPVTAPSTFSTDSGTVARGMLAGAGSSTQLGPTTALPEPTRSSGAVESHSSLAAQLPAAAYHEMEEAALAILQMINDTATGPAHALAGSPSTTATSHTPGSPAPSSMSSPPDAAAALTPAMDDLALSSSPAPENAPYDILVEDVDGMAEMGAAALLAMNHYAPSDPSSSPPNANAAGALGPPPPPPAKTSSSASPSFVSPRRRVKSLSAATASSTGPRTAAANLIMARRSSLHGLEPASALAAAAAAAASTSARPRPRPAHLPPPLSSSTSRKRRRSLSAAEHLIIGQLARSPLATSFLSAMAAGPAPSSSSSSHLHPSSAASSSSSSETAGKRRRLTLTSRDLSSATEEVVDLQSAATALVGGGGMPRSPPPPLHSVSPAAGARPRSLHSIQEDMDEEAQLEGGDGAGHVESDAIATSGEVMAPMQL